MEARKRNSQDDPCDASPQKILKSDDHGTSGVPVELIANFFKIEKLPEFSLNQYRVDFEPDLDVTNNRKKLVGENKSRLGGRYLFDGASMFMTQDIGNMEIDTAYEGRPMKIKIRKTGQVESSDPSSFQLFNLIFREAMAGLKLQNVRRDFFDPQAKINVPAGKLELWPGYITSIRAHDNDVLMNAEIAHKVMRKDTILEIAKRLMVSNNWKEELKRLVIGSTVLTEYTNKTYMIDDIDFGMTPKSTFKPSYKDETTRYIDYYQSRYGLRINDEGQFMLMTKSKERDIRAGQPEFIHLVPELCRATGMTDEMRNNFQLMKDLSIYTRLNPQDRVKALKKFNRRIQETPESVKVLEEWQMKLSTELIQIRGRELPDETIQFGQGESAKASNKAEWKLGKGVHLHKPVTIQRWVVIFPEAMRGDTDKFLEVLKTNCTEMGCEMKEPMKVALNGEAVELYVTEIKDIAAKKPNMILVVLPTNRADRYNAVKKLGLVDLGISIQVVTKRAITNKNLFSIASKVAIQMNAKLGGLPWMVNLPVKGLMTVGFDVSLHPRDKSRSIGALVATMDLKDPRGTGAFYSVTTSYRDGNEMNVHLADHMRKALTMYKEKCGAFPERIIFYRDGVGDGQIQYLMQKEVNPLIEKLKDLYGEMPKLAYIVVNKRTNTRLFKKIGSSVANPKPGTVVDQEITLPDRHDFVLVSQHVGQGTVSPTSYNIVYNTSKLNKDKLEMLTYKFTHLYYNWSGTTRIPAVSQYAKKLAFLTSQSLERPVHENLIDKLYFL